jgi:hypothetical protein
MFAMSDKSGLIPQPAWVFECDADRGAEDVPLALQTIVRGVR